MSAPFRSQASPSAAKRSQAGFSLIEILVSAVVTAVLATSAFYFLSQQNGAGTASNDVMKSINLGKEKMDSLKVLPYASLTSGSGEVADRYSLAWHITVMQDGGGNPTGRKKIDMSVTWPLTGEHTVSLTTLKSDDSFREPK